MTLADNPYHGFDEIPVSVGVLFAQAPQILRSGVQKSSMEERRGECQAHRVMLPRILMSLSPSNRFFALCFVACLCPLKQAVVVSLGPW